LPDYNKTLTASETSKDYASKLENDDKGIGSLEAAPASIAGAIDCLFGAKYAGAKTSVSAPMSRPKISGGQAMSSRWFETSVSGRTISLPRPNGELNPGCSSASYCPAS
jgi:hypothetical protein